MKLYFENFAEKSEIILHLTILSRIYSSLITSITFELIFVKSIWIIHWTHRSDRFFFWQSLFLTTVIVFLRTSSRCSRWIMASIHVYFCAICFVSKKIASNNWNGLFWSFRNFFNFFGFNGFSGTFPEQKCDFHLVFSWLNLVNCECFE